MKNIPKTALFLVLLFAMPSCATDTQPQTTETRPKPKPTGKPKQTEPGAIRATPLDNGKPETIPGA